MNSLQREDGLWLDRFSGATRGEEMEWETQSDVCFPQGRGSPSSWTSLTFVSSGDEEDDVSKVDVEEFTPPRPRHTVRRETPRRPLPRDLPFVKRTALEEMRQEAMVGGKLYLSKKERASKHESADTDEKTEEIFKPLTEDIPNAFAKTEGRHPSERRSFGRMREKGRMVGDFVYPAMPEIPCSPTERGTPELERTGVRGEGVMMDIPQFPTRVSVNDPCVLKERKGTRPSILKLRRSRNKTQQSYDTTMPFVHSTTIYTPGTLANQQWLSYIMPGTDRSICPSPEYWTWNTQQKTCLQDSGFSLVPARHERRDHFLRRGAF